MACCLLEFGYFHLARQIQAVLLLGRHRRIPHDESPFLADERCHISCPIGNGFASTYSQMSKIFIHIGHWNGAYLPTVSYLGTLFVYVLFPFVRQRLSVWLTKTDSSLLRDRFASLGCGKKKLGSLSRNGESTPPFATVQLDAHKSTLLPDAVYTCLYRLASLVL